MDKPFFVMMYNQKGNHAGPMTDEDGDVAFFETGKAALAVCKDHGYAQAFGYEIFEMGTGDV